MTTRETVRRFAVGTLLAAAVLVVHSASARAGDEIRERVEWAAEAYHDLVAAPDAGVPRWLLGEAKCIAVVPHVVKGAFLFGARYGRGVITCRSSRGEWSPPVFIKLGGPSFGLQWGAQATDLVLFFRKERGVRSLLESRLTLGGDAGVAAGPVGRRAEAGVDVKLNADILSYARTKGAFLGVSFEGTYLSADSEANRRYYGSEIDPEAVLFRGEVDLVPSSARALLDQLP
ncbi:MAG: hypothetical protein D6760_11905 [Deltaproteobacteria bacterium]|nr:MAG: hypothetical protein D6760_11905 [Deltaproteobacteria bacterium]